MPETYNRPAYQFAPDRHVLRIFTLIQRVGECRPGNRAGNRVSGLADDTMRNHHRPHVHRPFVLLYMPRITPSLQ